MIETPIPQGDVAGNAQIRRLTDPLPCTLAAPIMTTLQHDVTDGFVVCAGANSIMQQSAISAQ